jgi:hypothetical protein
MNESQEIDENEKALRAFSEHPLLLQGFYEAHFTVYEGSRPVGTFVGLACRVCNTFISFGHKEDCPMPNMEKFIRHIEDTLTGKTGN